MKIPYLLVRNADLWVQCVVMHDDPDAGPFIPQNEAPAGYSFVRDEWSFSRVGRTATQQPYLREDGQIEWVETATLDELRAKRAADISNACREHIEQGFTFPALGAPHLYPAKQQDQANLIGSVADSLLFADDPAWTTPFWCADEAGTWEFRLHTRAQIQQVGRAGKASILAAMQKNELIQRQIAAANAEQLAAIVW